MYELLYSENDAKLGVFIFIRYIINMAIMGND